MIDFIVVFFSRAVHLITGVEACCRYEPSCSQYFRDATHRFGIFRGTVLGVRRIFRCRPFGGHGFDPVHNEGGK